MQTLPFTALTGSETITCEEFGCGDKIGRKKVDFSAKARPRAFETHSIMGNLTWRRCCYDNINTVFC